MKRFLHTAAALLLAAPLSAQWIAQPSNVTPGLGVQFVDAVNATTCWGLAVDPTDQTNPIQEFTRTTDGLNWTDGIINNASGLCPASICAISADTAWVAMFEPNGGQGKILKTTDGGVNWTWQSTASFSLTGNFPDFVYFWDANNGVCMGDPTSGYFEIYTTVDGGNTWVRTPSANIAPIVSGEFGITDVSAAEGDSMIFFGTNKGRIYRSTDRGLHWTAHTTPYTNLYIGAIAFRDSLNGICVPGSTPGSVSPARTTDGGLTWVSTGGNTAGMTLMQSLAYLPGSDSTYFVTSPFQGSINGSAFSPNDGNGWVLIDNLFHSDVDFVNDSVGWTGSYDANTPMYKWETPIHIPNDEVATQHLDMATNVGLSVQIPAATFINNGIVPATFNVTMNITGGYSSTKPVTSLPFASTLQVLFDPWTPATTGPYIVQVYTSLPGDVDNTNDTLVSMVTVYDELANHGWVSKPPTQLATFGLASAFHLVGATSSSDGNIFGIGGAATGAVSASCRMTSTWTNAWFYPDSMPSAKYQFSAQKVGDYIICSGGYSTGFTPDGNTYIFDLSAGTWSSGAAMPVPVGDYASGVYADSLVYFIGGFDGASDQSIVQIYHVPSNTWSFGTPKTGTDVSGLRGGINMNNIIVAGGYSQTLATTIAEAQKGVIDPVNPDNITWTTIALYPGGPTSRLGAGTTFMNFLPVIVFTGGDPDGAGTSVKNDCWAYDVVQDKWLIAANKITAVSNISDLVGIIHNDSLWMASISGYNGTALTTVNEWLNLGPFLWTNVKSPAPGNLVASVYPNPASHELNIVVRGKCSRLEIADVTGRLVHREDVVSSQPLLITDVSKLTPGIYFLRLTGEDGAASVSKFTRQ